jgi:hypothetical protein
MIKTLSRHTIDFISLIANENMTTIYLYRVRQERDQIIQYIIYLTRLSNTIVLGSMLNTTLKTLYNVVF